MTSSAVESTSTEQPEPQKETPRKHALGFERLGVEHATAKALAGRGIQYPTPIQLATVPEALMGHNGEIESLLSFSQALVAHCVSVCKVIASAKTGTGKTAAYGVPLLQRLAESPDSEKRIGPRAIVLVPTRQLASQVTGVFLPFAHRRH